MVLLLMINAASCRPELSPEGCSIFDAAAALLVGHRTIKDILPPLALLQRQISSNAPVPIYEMGSQHITFPPSGESHARRPTALFLPTRLATKGEPRYKNISSLSRLRHSPVWRFI